MALYAHPFKPAVKLVKRCEYGQFGGAGFFPVTDDQIQDEFFFPFDKGVAQEGNQVIGNRAVECVLEVEYAWAAGCEHEVADDEVSVDVHLRLGKQLRQQGVYGLLPKLALFEVEFASEFFGDEPFGEKVDFAQPQ